VGGVPGFLSEANGPTHQAIEDVALMRGVPNMQVLCPADELEVDHALRAAFASGKPTYIRHYAGPARIEHQPYEIGRAEVLHDGHDVTLLTYGLLLSQVLVAREALEARRISTRVVNMRSLSPIDDRAILRAASDSKLLVTVEDHFQTGGLFSIVAETLALAGKGTRVLPIALDKKWFRPALLSDVLRVEGFRGEDLANRVKAVLET
jgi:transketolase